jgi:hypothetical protein
MGEYEYTVSNRRVEDEGSTLLQNDQATVS